MVSILFSLANLKKCDLTLFVKNTHLCQRPTFTISVTSESVFTFIAPRFLQFVSPYLKAVSGALIVNARHSLCTFGTFACTIVQGICRRDIKIYLSVYILTKIDQRDFS